MFVRERLELRNWLEAQLLLFFLKSWSTMAVIQPAPHCTFDGCLAERGIPDLPYLFTRNL